MFGCFLIYDHVQLSITSQGAITNSWSLLSTVITGLTRIRGHGLITGHDVKSITTEIKLLENIVQAVIAYLEEIPECIYIYF